MVPLLYEGNWYILRMCLWRLSTWERQWSANKECNSKYAGNFCYCSALHYRLCLFHCITVHWHFLTASVGPYSLRTLSITLRAGRELPSETTLCVKREWYSDADDTTTYDARGHCPIDVCRYVKRIKEEYACIFLVGLWSISPTEVTVTHTK